MQKKLIEILSNYSLEDAIKAEENDRQFLAIKKMNEKIGNSDYFFPIIITNALVWYQLSSSWEDYWEELAEIIIDASINTEKYIRIGENGYNYYYAYRTPQMMANGISNAINYVIKWKM